MSDPAEERLAVLDNYRKKLRELRELEARLKANRASVHDLVKEFNETEDNLRSLQVRSRFHAERWRGGGWVVVRRTAALDRRPSSQSELLIESLQPRFVFDLSVPQMIGQIIGEVLKQLDESRFIVKVCAVWYITRQSSVHLNV